MIKGAAYQAIKLGLMLIQSCRGERLGTALALNTLLVIWLPIVRISLQRKHECESINSTSFALMIRLTLIKHINSWQMIVFFSLKHQATTHQHPVQPVWCHDSLCRVDRDLAAGALGCCRGCGPAHPELFLSLWNIHVWWTFYTLLNFTPDVFQTKLKALRDWFSSTDGIPPYILIVPWRLNLPSRVS